MKIFVDKREDLSKRWAEKIKEMGVEVEVSWLEAGDFLIKGGESTILIERKSVSDLVNSVISKRLFEQLDALTHQEVPFSLMITGDPIELSRRFRTMGRDPNLVWNVFLGIQNELALSGIPTIVVPEEALVPRTLYLLAKKMETGVRPSLRVVKRSRTLADEQIEVLGTIRGLGIVKAKALIERFKTLRRIANASLAELADVRGIGNKIAQHVIEVFTTPYEEAREIKLSRKKSLIYWEQ
ncbi:MAG TPA: hypothetical protein EYP68_01585 [Candidatus Korarchaeota archaeon]|nr:hypothetical protein [Candidatus Korarchaeota archaeon]